MAVALFVWSFFAAALLPVGSELPFAVLVRREGQILVPILVATSGNSLGAFTTYWLGRRAAAFAEGRHAVTPRAQRAAELVRRHGQPIVAFSWVPMLGDALVVADRRTTPLAPPLPEGRRRRAIMGRSPRA